MGGDIKLQKSSDGITAFALKFPIELKNKNNEANIL